VEEAGFTLTPDAARKAPTVLGQAESRHRSGNARLAVRLLDQAASCQAHRIMALPVPAPSTLSTISSDDLPGHIYLDEPSSDDGRPGHYL